MAGPLTRPTGTVAERSSGRPATMGSARQRRTASTKQRSPGPSRDASPFPLTQRAPGSPHRSDDPAADPGASSLPIRTCPCGAIRRPAFFPIERAPAEQSATSGFPMTRPLPPHSDLRNVGSSWSAMVDEVLRQDAYLQPEEMSPNDLACTGPQSTGSYYAAGRSADQSNRALVARGTKPTRVFRCVALRYALRGCCRKEERPGYPGPLVRCQDA